MIRQLHSIGNNMNQIARIANATKHIEAGRYDKELEKLCGAINRIEEAVLLPEKIKYLDKWTTPN